MRLIKVKDVLKKLNNFDGEEEIRFLCEVNNKICIAKAKDIYHFDKGKFIPVTVELEVKLENTIQEDFENLGKRIQEEIDKIDRQVTNIRYQ